MGFGGPTDWTILPGRGLGTLRFGAPQHEVARYLGKPDDVSDGQAAGDDLVAWYYWELGVSATFDAEGDFRLCALDVEREDATLHGLRLIGLTERGVRELLAPFDLGRSEPHELPPDENRKLIAYPDRQIFFYFTDGRLESIDWTPFRDADGRLIWPDSGDPGRS